MREQDVFVEKFVAFRKLATAEQLQAAKAAVAENPGTSLLQALSEMGRVGEADARAILQAFEKSRAGQARPAAPAPPRQPPAGAPSPGPRPEPPPLVPEADASRVSSFTQLDEYLTYARELGASDLHVTPHCPPVIRRFGRLGPLPREPLAPAETERLLFSILSDEQAGGLRERDALDFCYAAPQGDRYRSCIVRQRTGWDGCFRVIQATVPTFAELGLPEQLTRLVEFNQGLVLITGPNGCGKSTTMAAMVELINQRRSEHIITLEDPVEFHFVPVRAQINQRQVGAHTKSFSAALRAAQREDPDVIMIGELRDRETVSLAITAAETGHLVFGTLHTTSAARTIDRILDVFPPDEQGQIRSMVSESIRGVVCQQLIRRADGTGRALALEIMLNNAAVANMIRERKLFQIPSVLQTSKLQGMMLLDQSLLELATAGVIDGVDAFFAADSKSQFQRWAPSVDGHAVEA